VFYRFPYKFRKSQILTSHLCLHLEFEGLKLTDLEVLATLGVGGFGRVELVNITNDKRKRTFALKCLKKKHIVETQQQEHVYSEKRIMMNCNHQFIAK
jgi:cGMP-dependent protein kinase